jgi:peptide-methionine (S)-S-oxide reductase
MRTMMMVLLAGASVALAADAPKATETVVLAGGCFWGTQGIFEHVKGVTDTVVGYAGGKKETATYEQVEEGVTGHAESVKVTYDPSKIVTKVDPLTGFYKAEEHHQHFMDRNPDQGYIVNVDIPLLQRFEEKYPQYYKK